MATRNDVIRQLMSMAELSQRSLTKEAATAYLKALSDFPDDVVMAALEDCMRTIPRFPAPAEVVQRCQASDGRPGAEEAWAMIPKDEYGSVVWTQEMAVAFGGCASLMASDLVGARMAFKEAYAKELVSARARKVPVKWSPSFGYDKRGRETAVIHALERNRITSASALAMIPELGDRADIHPKIAAIARGALEHKS